jgi:hypothetical protein
MKLRCMKIQAAKDRTRMMISETLTRVPEIKSGTMASYWNITDCGKLNPAGSFHGPSSK